MKLFEVIRSILARCQCRRAPGVKLPLSSVSRKSLDLTSSRSLAISSFLTGLLSKPSVASTESERRS